MRPTNIAVFASGSGSNAKKIAEHFSGSNKARVRLIVTNNPAAGVLKHAADHNVPTVVLTKDQLYDSNYVGDIFLKYDIGFIILAGFLLKVPEYLVRQFHDRIINIHPALLPRHGGKGMYGRHVHEAVKNCGDRETGITIHLVNEHYDEGRILFQARCSVGREDTPAQIAEKVQQLEHRYYPEIIEKYIDGEL